MFNSQPQFTIKAGKNKAFDESCLIDTFKIESGNIADCLEHCLENCRCQSFQICQNTECQLCSSHKEENSSLLRDKMGCVYAMYEMRHLTGHLQKLEEQCSGMSCLMKYNCCQQSGLCLKNEICKPINSLKQPWKRFTCECPDGYHGDNCDQPITSCQGYANCSRKSGMYQVVDSDLKSVYQVYCHFDSDGAWTLVQSFSFANGSDTTKFKQFRKPLSDDLPVGENNLAWSGYRFGKARMKSIEENSVLLRFTCNHHVKTHNVKKSDYLQILLKDLQENVVELNGYSSNFPIQSGKIGGMKLKDGCLFNLYQYHSMNLHASYYLSTCGITPSPTASHCNTQSYYSVFGNYNTGTACFEKTHECLINSESTTQLWFGH